MVIKQLRALLLHKAAARQGLSPPPTVLHPPPPAAHHPRHHRRLSRGPAARSAVPAAAPRASRSGTPGPDGGEAAGLDERIASPWAAGRSARESVLRATALSRSRAACANSRPKPREEPVTWRRCTPLRCCTRSDSVHSGQAGTCTSSERVGHGHLERCRRSELCDLLLPVALGDGDVLRGLGEPRISGRLRQGGVEVDRCPGWCSCGAGAQHLVQLVLLRLRDVEGVHVFHVGPGACVGAPVGAQRRRPLVGGLVALLPVRAGGYGDQLRVGEVVGELAALGGGPLIGSGAPSVGEGDNVVDVDLGGRPGGDLAVVNAVPDAGDGPALLVLTTSWPSRARTTSRVSQVPYWVTQCGNFDREYPVIGCGAATVRSSSSLRTTSAGGGSGSSRRTAAAVAG